MKDIVRVLIVGFIFNAGSVFCGELAVDFDNTRSNLTGPVISGNIEAIPVPEVTPFGKAPYIMPVENLSGSDTVCTLTTKVLNGDGTETIASTYKFERNKGIVQEAPSYDYMPGAQITQEFTCTGSGGGTWNICDYYLFNAEVSGHAHYDGIPSYTDSFTGQPLSSPLCARDIPVNTSSIFFLTAPQVAVQAAHNARAWGDCTGTLRSTKNFRVTPGIFSEMGSGTGYELVSYSPDHPKNHYGIKILIDALKTISSEYKKAFPGAPRLKIMDMSLVWGGLFDIGPTTAHPEWLYWAPPHSGHKFGANADIEKEAVPEGNREKLLEIMRKYGNVNEESTYVPDYHFTVSPLPKENLR